MQTRLSALILTGVATTFLATAGWAQTVLNFNSQFLEHTVTGQAERWFSEEMARRTDGEVEIRMFFGGGLGAPGEGLSLLADGAIDMASTSVGFFPAELPLSSALGAIPMALDTLTHTTVLIDRVLDEVPQVREEHARLGVRALYFQHLNPYYLVSRVPITGLADLDGLRMRTWGSEMPRLAAAAGAVPVSLFVPELYESFARGVIDVAPFSLDFTRDHRLYEVAPHFTTVPVYVGISSVAWISDDAWNRLTEEQQAILLEVAAETRQMDYEMMGAAADEARAHLEAQGVTFHDFPEADMEAWQAANPDFFGDFIARMEGLGLGAPAGEIVRLWREVRAGG